MVSVRGYLPVFSSLFRLPAHSGAQPVAVPRFGTEKRRLTTTCGALRCRCGYPFSSTDDGAVAVVSPLASRLPAGTMCCPMKARNDHHQQHLEACTIAYCSGSSLRRVAPLPPFLRVTFFSARRSVTTLRSGTSVSRAPAAAPSPRESPAVVTALEEAAASAAPDSPTLIHHSIRFEKQLLARMRALKTYLLAANWQDYLSFVLNSSFWEAEMRHLEIEAGPFKGSSLRVNELLRDLRRIFDLMAQASDVRDHINQIMELGSRSTGLAGTGLNAADKVENFEDHVQAAVAEYDRLLKEYPEYCSLVDDCLGSGLAMMRQKQRFTFSALHRFFY